MLALEETVEEGAAAKEAVTALQAAAHAAQQEVGLATVLNWTHSNTTYC